jgi:hypothetical protein
MHSTISYPIETPKPGLSENLLSKSSATASLTVKTAVLEKKRLVVLVSPYIVDETEFSKYILSLADKKFTDVLLLMLATNYEDEANGHLQLFTINSLLTGFAFTMKSQMVYGKSWENNLKPIVTEKDTVVCPHDVMVSVGIFSKESLSVRLGKKLNANMIIYAGFVKNDPVHAHNPVRALTFWIGAIAIIVSFFWLGSLIDTKLAGWIATLFLSILTLVQIALGYLWFLLLGK